MDIQLLAIAAAIILIVVILVSCFLFVGTRERSFEDALAEQQGLNLLLAKDHADSASQSSHKKHQKDVKKKKPPTAVKSEPPRKEKKPDTEKSSSKKDHTPPTSGTPTPSTISADGRSAAEEDESATAFVEEHPQPKKNASTRKEKPRKKRTISGGNVDEIDLAASASSVEDVQLHEEHPQDPAVEISPSSSLVDDLISSSMVEEQQLAPTTQTTTVEQTKKTKKNKSKSKHLTDSTTSAEKKFDDGTTTFVEDNGINSVLEKLKLPSLSDMQLEVISGFYSKLGEWSTAHSKPDPIVTLKKQLEEKELLLANETQLAAAANQKLKELKLEMNTDKQRLAASERNFNEKITLKQNENQNLAQKLREIQNQMTSKMQSYRQMEAQLMQYRSAVEQSNPAQLQQLREENQRLKERMACHEQDVLSRSSELQRLKQELITRETQIHRLEQQRQDSDQRYIQLEQRAKHDNGVAQQLAECQAKLMQKDQDAGQLTGDLNNLRQEFLLLEQTVSLLRQQLNERDVQVQTLQYQTSAAPSGDSNTKVEMERLRNDLNETRAAKDSYMSELSQVNLHMSDLDKQLSEMTKRMLDQDAVHSRVLEQKDGELARLKDDVQHLRHDNANLAEQRNKNEDARYKELENALNAKNKLDADVQQLKNDLDAAKQKLREQEGVEKQLRNDLENSVTNVEKLNNELSRLSSNNSDIVQLQQHVSVLESTVVGRDNTVTKLEDELKDSQLRCDDYESQVGTLRKQIDEITKEHHTQNQRVQTLSNDNAKLLEQIRIQQAVNGHSEVASVIIDPDVLKVNERSMAQLNKQLINKDGEIANLKEQLEILRQKNIELRDKKYKAVESVQQMEKNTKELIDKIETKFEKETQQKEKHIKDALSKCLPEFHAQPNSSFHDYVREFEHHLKKTLAKNTVVAVEPPVVVKQVHHQSPELHETRVKLGEITKENDHLHKQLSHYKTVLAQTEGLLQGLERNALEQESLWKTKYVNLESQINQSRQETSSRLEDSLKSSETFKKQLETLKTMLEKEKHERETLVKDLTSRQTELETERATSRDLSAQAVKLRGMLKTGQDALKQEQDLVSQLQKHVKSLQEEQFRRVSGQISEEDKGGRGIHEELDELRKKLSQRESQLEKEMIINKQLNNKLASLGVTTALGFSS